MVEGLTNERKDQGERADKCCQGFVYGSMEDANLHGLDFLSALGTFWMLISMGGDEESEVKGVKVKG